jgi:hypothetical protein
VEGEGETAERSSLVLLLCMRRRKKLMCALPRDVL